MQLILYVQSTYRNYNKHNLRFQSNQAKHNPNHRWTKQRRLQYTLQSGWRKHSMEWAPATDVRGGGGAPPPPHRDVRAPALLAAKGGGGGWRRGMDEAQRRKPREGHHGSTDERTSTTRQRRRQQLDATGWEWENKVGREKWAGPWCQSLCRASPPGVTMLVAPESLAR